MTLEERHATVLWMAEHGYEEDKNHALREALARLTGINLSPVTITVVGEIANTALIAHYNIMRKRELNNTKHINQQDKIMKQGNKRMKQYIGVKAVYAEPMTAGEAEEKGFAKFTGDVRPGKDTPGYHVHYPDGYDSWSPKHVFEAAYFGMEGYDTVSPADVQNFQRSVESVRVGTKTTNTTITLLTGYEVHGQSACVNPDNYNLGIGQKYAKPHAEDKIWEYLGFVLQWAKFGLKK